MGENLRTNSDMSIPLFAISVLRAEGAAYRMRPAMREGASGYSGAHEVAPDRLQQSSVNQKKEQHAFARRSS
jgi:hypothetical protein